MPCKYLALNGEQDIFDLDSVIDVVRGKSPVKTGWTALIVYQPESKKFIELRDSPQDFRGNSKDEAEEVTPEYVAKEFEINSDFFLKNIKNWNFIDKTL